MRIGTEPNKQVVHPARNVVLQGIKNTLEKTAEMKTAFATLFDGAIVFPSPARFGVFVNDGATNDKAVIDLAFAANNNVAHIPKGVAQYGTDDTGGELSGKRVFGQGVLKTGVNKRARETSHLNAAPAIGDVGSVVTAFNGDFSKSINTREFRVAGSVTLGNPLTGEYAQRPEAAGTFSFGYVGSNAGKNLATDWTDGRTGWSFDQYKIHHYGQGDVAVFTLGIDVWQNKAGATHFLANPAGTLINGGVTAWVNNVNIVGAELYISGQSYDVNGTGLAIHLNRNNATGAQEAFWRGISIISSGSQAITFAFGIRGKAQRGLSLELGDFGAAQAAISMGNEQAIVFNSSSANTGSANPLATGYKILSTLGDAKLYYSVISAVNSFIMTKPLIVAGQISSDLATGNNRGLNLKTSGVNKWCVLLDGSENFKVSRHDSGGAELDQPIFIESDGDMRVGVTGKTFGFYGSSGAVKPTITGSRGGNAALADFLTKMAGLGILTDSTS